jgi:hypothetical protein
MRASASPSTIIRALIAAIVIGAIIPTFGVLGTYGGDATISNTTGGVTTLETDRGIPETLEVDATTERAVAFGTGDGYVDATAGARLTRGSWSVCAAASLDADADLDAAYTVAAYDNGSLLLLYDNQKWVSYFDNGSHDAMATVSAPDPTSGFTPVCARYNATANNLTIARNQTIAPGTPLTTATASRNLSVDWFGALDEVRTFNESLTDNQITSFGSEPLTPLPSADRSARLMLDGTGSEAVVYFASPNGTIVNGSRTAGVADVSLSEGTDYSLGEYPFTVRIPSGSFLRGAPVAYIQWSGTHWPLGLQDVFLTLAYVVLLAFLALKLIGP